MSWQPMNGACDAIWMNQQLLPTRAFSSRNECLCNSIQCGHEFDFDSCLSQSYFDELWAGQYPDIFQAFLNT